MGPLREDPQVADTRIELERRYNDTGIVTHAILDFDVRWNNYDEDGEEPYSSDDHVEVRVNGMGGNWYLGRIIATGGVGGWRFTLDEPEGPQFPGDDE